jgi:hypothetical protein
MLLTILTRDLKFRFVANCAVEFVTNHEQQLPLITVECSDQISNCVHSVFHSVPPLVLRSQSSSTCWPDRRRSSSWCPFGHFRTLCASFWHPALTLRHHRIALSISVTETRFVHKTRIITYKQFPSVLPLHINWYSDWHLCHLLCVSPTTSATFYPQIECLINPLKTKRRPLYL